MKILGILIMICIIIASFTARRGGKVFEISLGIGIGLFVIFCLLHLLF